MSKVWIVLAIIVNALVLLVIYQTVCGSDTEPFGERRYVEVRRDHEKSIGEHELGRLQLILDEIVKDVTGSRYSSYNTKSEYKLADEIR